MFADPVLLAVPPFRLKLRVLPVHERFIGRGRGSIVIPVRAVLATVVVPVSVVARVVRAGGRQSVQAFMLPLAVGIVLCLAFPPRRTRVAVGVPQDPLTPSLLDRFCAGTADVLLTMVSLTFLLPPLGRPVAVGPSYEIKVFMWPPGGFAR